MWAILSSIHEYLMANFKEGLDALTNKEYDKALEILLPFAEEGDAEAQFH